MEAAQRARNAPDRTNEDQETSVKIMERKNDVLVDTLEGSEEKRLSDNPVQCLGKKPSLS